MNLKQKKKGLPFQNNKNGERKGWNRISATSNHVLYYYYYYCMAFCLKPPRFRWKKKFAQEEKVILRSREENRCFSSGRAWRFFIVVNKSTATRWLVCANLIYGATCMLKHLFLALKQWRNGGKFKSWDMSFVMVAICSLICILHREPP